MNLVLKLHRNIKGFILIFILAFAIKTVEAEPDTVKVGAYIMSVHDINFQDNEYTVRCWLWFKYKKNRDFDFVKQLDITNAKTIEYAEPLYDTAGQDNYLVMLKLKCVMKDNWQVLSFPFDEQNLIIHIENSLFDKKFLVFAPDIKGSKYDSEGTLMGWKIKKFTVFSSQRNYETNFGDDSIAENSNMYSVMNISIDIKRNAWGLFLKIFIGMYFGFLISLVGFAPKPWELEARFSLPVGGLFAAVGNKYIIDSTLPESLSFTLVDSLHAVTFLAILASIVVSAICMKQYDNNKTEQCLKTNKIGAWVVLISYVALNILLVTISAW